MPTPLLIGIIICSFYLGFKFGYFRGVVKPLIIHKIDDKEIRDELLNQYLEIIKGSVERLAEKRKNT